MAFLAVAIPGCRSCNNSHVRNMAEMSHPTNVLERISKDPVSISIALPLDLLLEVGFLNDKDGDGSSDVIYRMPFTPYVFSDYTGQIDRTAIRLSPETTAKVRALERYHREVTRALFLESSASTNVLHKQRLGFLDN
ncbi:hypothetical protein FJZ17_02145 [Candidatus Pacearchaeota archaeon]|nr:hypothetical protein [Candidatus Pacearchaeota archaeon]